MADPAAAARAPAPVSADKTREERQRIADQAEHSSALEGVAASRVGRALRKRWIDGEITLDEYQGALRAHYSAPPLDR